MLLASVCMVVIAEYVSFGSIRKTEFISFFFTLNTTRRYDLHTRTKHYLFFMNSFSHKLDILSLVVKQYTKKLPPMQEVAKSQS